MIKAVKDAYKKHKKKKAVAKITGSPHDRLEMMKAGYKKFTTTMTERERAKMKKEIKKLERAVKEWDKAVLQELRDRRAQNEI